MFHVRSLSVELELENPGAVDEEEVEPLRNLSIGADW